MLVAGGNRAEQGTQANGFYVEPTIFDNCTPDMAIVREEIFGPVIAFLKANLIEKALEMANDTEYGLSASIFTTSVQNFRSFLNDMEAAGLIRIFQKNK